MSIERRRRILTNRKKDMRNGGLRADLLFGRKREWPGYSEDGWVLLKGVWGVTGGYWGVCAHHWRLPLEQVPGKAGGKGKERKEILLSAGKKRLRATHHFFGCSLIVRAICSMGRGCSLVRK